MTGLPVTSQLLRVVCDERLRQSGNRRLAREVRRRLADQTAGPRRERSLDLGAGHDPSPAGAAPA
jgi:hypothetical protein